MRLLLDTHIVLWALADDPRLALSQRTTMREAEALHVSAVTIWEVAVKRALGKLKAPEDFPEVVRRTGMIPLSISWDHAAEAGALPPHHADPFDRLLIAQARVERLTMMTADRAFRSYEVDLA